MAQQSQEVVGVLPAILVMPGFMGQAWSNRRIALALRKFSCTKVSISGHANGVGTLIL